MGWGSRVLAGYASDHKDYHRGLPCVGALPTDPRGLIR